jgi:hypothetical protein
MQIPQAPDLTAREFERRLRELERGFSRQTANVSCGVCDTPRLSRELGS